MDRDRFIPPIKFKFYEINRVNDLSRFTFKPKLTHETLIVIENIIVNYPAQFGARHAAYGTTNKCADNGTRNAACDDARRAYHEAY